MANGRTCCRAESKRAYDLATIKKWLEVFLFRFFKTSQFKRSCVHSQWAESWLGRELGHTTRRLASAERCGGDFVAGRTARQCARLSAGRDASADFRVINSQEPPVPRPVMARAAAWLAPQSLEWVKE